MTNAPKSIAGVVASRKILLDYRREWQSLQTRSLRRVVWRTDLEPFPTP